MLQFRFTKLPMSAVQTTSPQRLAANRANAQKSTGPTTPEGKAISSLHAVKSGLTGKAVLLPSDDVAAYEAHIARFQKELQPVGDRETHLVQALADTQWRLDRIPNLETGLFALGRMRYADLFADVKDEPLRTMLLDAHILMTDAQHFKNLHLQEARLRRQFRQDLDELRQLQAERKEKEAPTRPETKPALRVAAVGSGFEFANLSSDHRGGEMDIYGQANPARFPHSSDAVSAETQTA
jgi:hypothetical protein